METREHAPTIYIGNQLTHPGADSLTQTTQQFKTSQKHAGRGGQREPFRLTILHQVEIRSRVEQATTTVVGTRVQQDPSISKVTTAIHWKKVKEPPTERLWGDPPISPPGKSAMPGLAAPSQLGMDHFWAGKKKQDLPCARKVSARP